MVKQERYRSIIKKRLTASRYHHSLEVAETAKDLAEIYGVDPKLALSAGLLHDYAKELPSWELLNIAGDQDLITDKVEQRVPDLLHGPVGAYLLSRDLNLTDLDLLSAVAYHTTGRAGMSKLELIIYIADMIASGRNFSGLERLRQLARSELEKAVLLGLEFTLDYCIRRHRLIHFLTLDARNYLLVQLEYNKEIK